MERENFLKAQRGSLAGSQGNWNSNGILSSTHGHVSGCVSLIFSHSSLDIQTVGSSALHKERGKDILPLHSSSKFQIIKESLWLAHLESGVESWRRNQTWWPVTDALNAHPDLSNPSSSGCQHLHPCAQSFVSRNHGKMLCASEWQTRSPGEFSAPTNSP